MEITMCEMLCKLVDRFFYAHISNVLRIPNIREVSKCGLENATSTIWVYSKMYKKHFLFLVVHIVQAGPFLMRCS